MAKWTVDIKSIVKNANADINTFKTNLAFALYSSVVKKTPVDTGRARANWNISTGKIDASTSSKTLKSGLKYKAGDIKSSSDETIYISNNLPYIQKLEFGGYPKDSKSGKTINGYSKQAPNGMVGVTMANIKNIVSAVAKRVGEK